jgi:phosphoglycerate dehydrogenase-like enzyme
VTSVPSQQDPAQVVAQSVVMDDLGPDWARRLADSCTVTAVDKLDDQPDALAQAQGLLLAAARRLQPNIALARSGENWQRNAVLGADVRAKTLGLVGMGRIATLVARSAQAGFGMNVLYRTRGERPAAPGRAVGAEGGLVLRCPSGGPKSFELARVS